MFCSSAALEGMVIALEHTAGLKAVQQVLGTRVFNEAACGGCGQGLDPFSYTTSAIRLDRYDQGLVEALMRGLTTRRLCERRTADGRQCGATRVRGCG